MGRLLHIGHCKLTALSGPTLCRGRLVTGSRGGTDTLRPTLASWPLLGVGRGRGRVQAAQPAPPPPTQSPSSLSLSCGRRPFRVRVAWPGLSCNTHPGQLLFRGDSKISRVFLQYSDTSIPALLDLRICFYNMLNMGVHLKLACLSYSLVNVSKSSMVDSPCSIVMP